MLGSFTRLPLRRGVIDQNCSFALAVEVVKLFSFAFVSRSILFIFPLSARHYRFAKHTFGHETLGRVHANRLPMQLKSDAHVCASGNMRLRDDLLFRTRMDSPSQPPIEWSRIEIEQLPERTVQLLRFGNR